MLRRALVPCLILSTAAVAHADAAAVAVRSINGPLELAMRLDARSEDSCSQSFASSHEVSSFSLRIDARGRAELELDRLEHDTFGPSRGRYSQGDRDFSRTTERATRTYRGRATRAGSELDLRFDRLTEGSVVAAGYGDVAAPPTTTGTVSLHLTCRVEPADVYPVERPASTPTHPADGETSQRVSLLRCTFPDGVPSGLGHVEQAGGQLVLGRSGGVAAYYHRMFGGGTTLLRLR